MELNKTYEGNVLQVLKTWPDRFIQTGVTSPPYWGLRDYGIKGQLGLEKTPEEYIYKMVRILREFRRCLRDDGTLWLNLGDSYAGSWGNYSKTSNNQSVSWKRAGAVGKNWRPPTSRTNSRGGLKPKDLCGIPWAIAFALRSDGWYLRRDIIWYKKNPMPESCTDRPTTAHEYIFLLTKSGDATYWTHHDKDGVRECPKPEYRWRDKLTGKELKHPPNNWKAIALPDDEETRRFTRFNLWQAHDYFYDAEAIREESICDRIRGPALHPCTDTNGNDGLARRDSNGARNKRSVWEVATQSYSEAHFATFPEKLIEPCILAGTSEKGCCEKCGAPQERRVKREFYGNWNPGPGSNGPLKMNDQKKERKGKFATETWEASKTVGWCPTCKCKAKTKPCVVCDPFMGAGTTALVACKFNRQYVGIELNPDYIKMSDRRIAQEKAQIKMF